MPIPPDGDDRIVSPPLTKREKALIRGLRYFRFRSRIRYSQARPTQILLPRETTRLDCSGLVACCMDFAGVKPNVDWRYTNTWVQIHWGVSRTLATAKPGDVVFYGPARTDPSHEALYLGTLTQLRKLIGVPTEVASEMAGGGRYVLSMGHYPMGIYVVDYRGDRIAIKDMCGAK